MRVGTVTYTSAAGQSRPISSFRDRVGAVACVCFERFRTILTFPLRFLGSKTWSVPGIILRTPWILFKRIFRPSPVPLKQELFGSGYHHSFEKTLTPTEVKPYLPYASAAGFIYSTNPSYVLSGWECIPPETLNLTSESVEARDKCFFDPDSGFKVTLLQKGNEVIVCVGAIEAQEQEKARSPKYQKAKNIAQSLLGVMPPVYKQALAFAKKIQACPQFAGKKLTLTGQCYGGAIASYLALKTKLPAVCLNSFPLGAGVQYDIGKDVLSEADKYVTHISSRHDFLTDLPFYTPLDLAVSALGIRAPGSFGRKYLIPTAYSAPLMSHAYILSSVLQHLGYDKRAYPKDLPLESN